MTKEQIDEFAKFLIQRIRDNAIKSCDTQLYSDNLNSPTTKRWQKARESGNIDKFAETIIADCIDDAIFYFLLAIDKGAFSLSFRMPNGENVALSDALVGELAGWYIGEWKEKYSRERI